MQYNNAFTQGVNYKNENDSIIKQIRECLYLSQPNKGLKLLFILLDIPNTNINTLNIGKILLSEAYRQNGKYSKGEEILISLINTFIY